MSAISAWPAKPAMRILIISGHPGPGAAHFANVAPGLAAVGATVPTA